MVPAEIFVKVKDRLMVFYKDFYRCSLFISMLLSQVDGQNLDGPKWQEKQMFCKFKAACGLQMLAEGQILPPGNPFVSNQQPKEEQMGIKSDLKKILEELEIKAKHLSGNYSSYGASAANSVKPVTQNQPTNPPIQRMGTNQYPAVSGEFVPQNPAQNLSPRQQPNTPTPSTKPNPSNTIHQPPTSFGPKPTSLPHQPAQPTMPLQPSQPSTNPQPLI